MGGACLSAPNNLLPNLQIEDDNVESALGVKRME